MRRRASARISRTVGSGTHGTRRCGQQRWRSWSTRNSPKRKRSPRRASREPRGRRAHVECAQRGGMLARADARARKTRVRRRHEAARADEAHAEGDGGDAPRHLEGGLTRAAQCVGPASHRRIDAASKSGEAAVALDAHPARARCVLDLGLIGCTLSDAAAAPPVGAPEATTSAGVRARGVTRRLQRERASGRVRAAVARARADASGSQLLLGAPLRELRTPAMEADRTDATTTREVGPAGARTLVALRGAAPRAVDGVARSSCVAHRAVRRAGRRRSSSRTRRAARLHRLLDAIGVCVDISHLGRALNIYLRIDGERATVGAWRARAGREPRVAADPRRACCAPGAGLPAVAGRGGHSRRPAARFLKRCAAAAAVVEAWAWVAGAREGGTDGRARCERARPGGDVDTYVSK